MFLFHLSFGALSRLLRISKIFCFFALIMGALIWYRGKTCLMYIAVWDTLPISKKAKKIRYPNQSSCQTKRKDKIEMRKWTYMDMTHFITFQTIGSVRTLPELFANGWCLFCYAAGAGCCSYCSSNCSRMLRIAAYRSFFKSSMPTGLWFKMTL